MHCTHGQTVHVLEHAKNAEILSSSETLCV